MEDHAGAADEQNPQSGDGLEGVHIEAAVAMNPWARKAPRNRTTERAGAQEMSWAVPEMGMDLAAAAARLARDPAVRAWVGLVPQRSRRH